MRSKFIFSLLVNCMAYVAVAQIGPITSIENVSVIPMTSDTIIRGQRVLIADGVIIGVEAAALPSSKAIQKEIDGNGKFLIPGLSEMHFHLRSNDIESDFKLLMANGITTVRNMAEFSGQDHIAIREKVKSGELFGPNYFTSGPYLTSLDLETEELVLQVVKDHKEKGYDYLKIADNLPKDTYLLLLQLAQEYGIKVVGHSQRNLPMEYSFRMKSIEHIEEFVYLKDECSNRYLTELNEYELHKIGKNLGEHGVYVGTTLTVYEFINQCINNDKFEALKSHPHVKYLHRDQRIFLTDKNDYRKLRDKMFGERTAEQLFGDNFIWMKSFAKTLSENHVNLLSGSDTYGMVIVGFSLHREFELLQESGLTPYEILLTSTVNPARYLETFTTEGTISEGKNANLVLLSNNPLDDIRNTQSIEGVMVKGKWISIDEIKKMLMEVEEAFR